MPRYQISGPARCVVGKVSFSNVRFRVRRSEFVICAFAVGLSGALFARLASFCARLSSRLVAVHGAPCGAEKSV